MPTVDSRSSGRLPIEAVVGANVRVGAAARNVSMPDLAAQAGIAAKTLNNAVATRHSMQLETLARVARGLGVEPWQLLVPLKAWTPDYLGAMAELVAATAELDSDAIRRVLHFARLEARAR